MERMLDLGFCKVVYSEEDKFINKEKKLIIKAFNYNKNFFKIKISKFEIKFVYSRVDFDKLWGGKTEKFISGLICDSKIVLFAYSIFDKETKWKRKDFYECLIHEISHLFYEELRDDSYDPMWLSEGLATFLQCNKKKFKYKKGLKIKKKILEEEFENMTIERYQVYLLFVEYLIFKFGKKKILELIKGLKRGKELNNLFQKIYKISFDELIKDGNKYQKTAGNR